MKFKYTPEGADTKEWTFKPGKMLNAESEKLEDLTGWTYAQFGQFLMSGSMKAYHALLYVFLRRTTPTLKYDEVVFAYDEIDIDLDDDERKSIIAELRSAGDDLDSDQRAFLETLVLEDAMAEPDPKDQGAETSDFAQPSDESGSGSSPTSSTSHHETSTS